MQVKKHKMKRHHNRHGIRMLSLVLTVAMVFSLIPQSQGITQVKAEGESIDLSTAATTLYQGLAGGWGDAAAEVAASGSTATITVSDFGNQSSEWQLQYYIGALGLSDNTAYQISFTITSTIGKKVFVKLDDSGLLEETLTLTANEAYQYEGTSTAGTFSNNTLYFAIGQFSGEDVDLSGTITISDIVITKVVDKVDEKGAEYDFNAVDNVTYDYEDPGTTKTGYELIWSDEFDGNYDVDANIDADTGLNLDNWSYQLGDGTVDASNTGWGNSELQSYSNRSKNVGVNEDLNGDDSGDGLLRITASYEEDGYTYYDTESTKYYSSARLRTTTDTESLFDTTYGYVEARISLPATKGAWPAFWMLPESTDIYGSWSVSGEIDIMETCGALSAWNNDATCSTVHWGTPSHVYKGSGYTALSSAYTYFHSYAVDWEPGKMTFYYDGVEIYSLENWESAISGASDSLSFDAPFDQPFYILLNLAVDSGNFGGSTNKATFQDDINMYVDYVRVYQRTEGYAESVVREETSDYNSDWADYADINQIAEIGTNNIVDDVTDGNVNSIEASSEVDSKKWYLAYQSDATDATATAYTDADDATWAKVGVNTAGSQDYSVQLIGHYDAKSGYVYKVSFDAYAEGGMIGKTVSCDSKEWSTWSTYGISQVTLNASSTSYSYLINQTENFENCRIEFNLGAVGTGTVYIGNVKVEIVDPEQLAAEETRSALADGNLIYNSTFDQGDYHLGYWSASEDTTVIVPRYTTKKIADDDISVVDVASMTNYEKLSDGLKYYERRAQISADTGVAPQIYQTGLIMGEDSYTLNFDMYSESDTTVTAAIYTVCTDADGEALGDKLYSTTANYAAEDGLVNYEWVVNTSEEIENAALVLTFAEGASVQIDNVTLIGASLAESVDMTPMDTETGWTSDNQDGSVTDLIAQDKEVTATVTSGDGTAWYAPQIISDDFALTSGYQYKLTYKYKMTGTSNNTFQYIVQENGGSWTVFGDGPTTVSYEQANADAEGYCTYETTFTAGSSLSNVHMVFGFGNSEATDMVFSFKDISLSVVSDGDSSGEETGSGSQSMPGSIYKITYELDGGANADANPTTYTAGEGVASLAAPTKSGYTFLGWSIGSTDTEYVTSISTSQTGNLVLYANWQEGETQTTEAPAAQTPTTQDDTTETPAEGTSGTEQAQAPKKGVSYTVGNYKYRVTNAATDGTGTVTLTGVEKKTKTVTIPATVTIDGYKYKITIIGNNSFKNNKKITKLVIGKNVTKIGMNAFYGCKNLKSVNTGTGVTTILNKAFYGCTSLKKLVIGKNVSKIGEKTFYNCKKLSNITIKSKKLKTSKVGKLAFGNIKQTVKITVPKAKKSAYKKMLYKKGVSKKATIK